MAPPLRNARNAPKFDEGHPEELLRYIEDIDELIKTHSITDEEEKKALLLHYTSVGVEHQWKALPSAATGKTYEDFKKGVLAEYPKADAMKSGMQKQLDKVLKKYKGSIKHELNELMAYKHKFNMEVSSLGALLSNSVQVEMFLSCLDPDFGHRIIAALALHRQAITSVVEGFRAANAGAAGNTLLFPPDITQREDDRYELSNVMVMAVDIVRQAVPITTSFKAARTLLSSTLDTIIPKSETMVMECLEQQENLLAQLKDSLLLSNKQQVDFFENFKKMHDGESAQFQQSQEPVKTSATVNVPAPGLSYQDNHNDHGNYNDYNHNKGYDPNRNNQTCVDGWSMGMNHRANPCHDDDCCYCGELGHYVSDCMV
ncbi:hypothetical protein D9619_005712 [Psilocybe cf. subviscida]|uniref:CCHC-type domain-containing protein n=1 Tax=Psilocybe cf. subviscida TaxID=2480587 RepID=A0A8H5BWN8_9AGAR|nr:hypothetical protein D9619_005712 [Psilocybe cf. subviscida]